MSNFAVARRGVEKLSRLFAQDFTLKKIVFNLIKNTVKVKWKDPPFFVKIPYFSHRIYSMHVYILAPVHTIHELHI